MSFSKNESENEEKHEGASDKLQNKAPISLPYHLLREGIGFEHDLMKKLKKLYSFFSNFEDEELLKILRVSERSFYKEGSIIFQEGSLANRLFIIIQGSVRIAAKVGERDEELSILGPGNCFGEMSLLDEAPRSATAVANEDCLVFSISEVILRNTDPFLCLKLFKNLAVELSRKLREADEKIKKLIIKKKDD